MKYIDADLLSERIEKNKYVIEPMFVKGDDSCYEGEYDAYNRVLRIIDSLQQEQPKLTQVPHIEQETQKKGWMDYGLLKSEIGLHRSNAIDRIKETKERATEIKRNIAPHDLAILCEYLESVGAEVVLCCLQRYCMDFMFTQDEVKEILQQEQDSVAERFAKIVRANLSEIGKNAQSQFEQLYLEITGNKMYGGYND